MRSKRIYVCWDLGMEDYFALVYFRIINGVCEIVKIKINEKKA